MTILSDSIMVTGSIDVWICMYMIIMIREKHTALGIAMRCNLCSDLDMKEFNIKDVRMFITDSGGQA